MSCEAVVRQNRPGLQVQDQPESGIELVEQGPRKSSHGLPYAGTIDGDDLGRHNHAVAFQTTD